MATDADIPSPGSAQDRLTRAKSLLKLGLEEEREDEPEKQNYRRLRELARGGMGVVFDVHDAKLRRSVAMKVLPHDRASPEETQRFCREAQVLGQLAHPNIVPIYDVGKDEQGRPFYTMKRVGGSTLHDILRGLKAGDRDGLAKYPLNALLQILQKVCDAVAFAHSRGVIHRDLKPQNIMVGEFGEVLVLDWGLAKILPGSPTDAAEFPQPLEAVPSLNITAPTGGEPGAETDTFAGIAAGTPPAAPTLDTPGTGFGAESDGQMTLPGAVMGTPNYMAPEQAAGLTEEVGPQSDVFALGGLLYAILTLRPPVEGKTREEVLSKVRQGDIVPPTGHSRQSAAAPPTEASGPPIQNTAAAAQLPHLPGGRVPAALSAVAMRALATNRAERYPSVTAFEADLAAYQGGFATRAEQAGLGRQLWLLVRRHRVLAASLAIIVLVSVSFVARLIVSERRAEKSAAEATGGRRTAEREREATRQALARSQISLAEAAYHELDSRKMIGALESVPPDLREGDWAYFRRRADNSQSRLQLPGSHFYIGGAGHPRQPGVFALASTERAIDLVEARTGKTRLRIPLSPKQGKSRHFRAVDFSPDGKQLLVGCLQGGSLSIYDTATGAPVVEWDSPRTDFARFNRTGTLILDINLSRELTVREPASGRILWNRKPFGRALFTSGDHVIASDGNTLRRLDARTGAVLPPLPPLRGRLFTMALSPDDSTLFYAGSADVFVRGMRLADGVVTFEQALTESPASWPTVALSADGAKVFGAVTDDGRKTVIRVWDTATGSRLRTLRGHDGDLESVAIHPLTDEVVVTGVVTHSWSLDAGRPPAWVMNGSVHAGVFLGADDLFTATGVPLKLNEPGAWDDRIAPLPNDFIRGNQAASNGEHGVIGVLGSRSRGISGANFLLARPDAAGLTLTPGTLKGRTSVTYRLRISPDGHSLAVCDDYSGLSLHETATGNTLCEGNPAASFRTLTAFEWLTPHRLIGLGSTRARGNADNEETIILWDAPSGRVLHKQVNASAMDCLAILPGGKLFAEAGADRRVRIRDGATLEVQSDFRAHDRAITALAAHPTQLLLATASADLFIRIWNLHDGTMLEELQPSVSVPRTLQFSPTGNRLASVDQRGKVRIWNFGHPPPVRRRKAPNDLRSR